MNATIELAERGLIPTPLLRAGIRRLIKKRLHNEAARHGTFSSAFAHQIAAAPIAKVPEAANYQHYEVPAEFFRMVLGKHLKYSAAYWPADVSDLSIAEEQMLRLTVGRAQIEDGQRILELGCGWGSLTLWMAKKFPNAKIVAASNSVSQRAFIEQSAKALGISNLNVLTADMNDFDPGRTFDRVVSVEMFEHIRNWPALLTRVRGWLHDEGRLFIHVFAHQKYAYPFETHSTDDWMGQNFFTGGMMPSLDLMHRLETPFEIEADWQISGTHYQRTAEAWLKNIEAKKNEVLALFARDLTTTEANKQYERWRLFFLACAESFGFRGGTEWLVAHYLLKPKAIGGRL